MISSEEDPSLEDYTIMILNSEGTVVDRFTDLDVHREGEQSGHPIRAYVIMKNLYNAARRKALGVDQALDAILAELGES